MEFFAFFDPVPDSRDPPQGNAKKTGERLEQRQRRNSVIREIGPRNDEEDLRRIGFTCLELHFLLLA